LSFGIRRSGRLWQRKTDSVGEVVYGLFVKDVEIVYVYVVPLSVGYD